MKKIGTIIGNLGLALLLVLTTVALIGRFQGRSLFVVLSGSMEPAYPVGGLIFTKPVAFTKLQVGDGITFRSQGKSQKVVTHRIVGVDQEQGSIQTKGDANQAVDNQAIVAQDVIGRVTYSLPYLGYGLLFLQSNLGKWSVLMTVISLLAWAVKGYFLTNNHENVAKVRTADGRR